MGDSSQSQQSVYPASAQESKNACITQKCPTLPSYGSQPTSSETDTEGNRVTAGGYEATDLSSSEEPKGSVLSGDTEISVGSVLSVYRGGEKLDFSTQENTPERPRARQMVHIMPDGEIIQASLSISDDDRNNHELERAFEVIDHIIYKDGKRSLVSWKIKFSCTCKPNGPLDITIIDSKAASKYDQAINQYMVKLKSLNLVEHAFVSQLLNRGSIVHVQ